MYNTPRQGKIEARELAAPAAGAELTIEVNAERRWRVSAIALSLTTGATAGDRIPSVRIVNPDGVVLLRSDAAAAQVASTNVRYQIANWGYAAASPKLILPLPLILPPLARIETVTTGILAEDTYGAPIVLLEEWDANMISAF